MENKKKSKLKFYVFAIIPVLSFMSVAFLTSYSFYLATVVGNEDNGDVILKSAQVFAMFEAEDNFSVENILPGYSGEIRFSITNTSPEEDLYGNYTLFWEITKNEINNDTSQNFVYTLSGVSEKDGVEVGMSDKNKLVNVSSNRRVPSISESIGSGMINTGVTHKYVLTVKFLESGTNQNDLQGKKFEGKIVAKGDPNIN